MNTIKKNTQALSFILSFLLIQGYAQSNKKTISELFKNKIEIYFSFDIKDRKELHTLTKIISIDNVQDKTVHAYANQKQFKKFSELKYKYTILTNPSEIIKDPKMLNLEDFKKRGVQAWDSWPTYSAYVAMMNKFQTDFPSICKLETIGTLASGHKLLALKISKNVNAREYEPQFLYNSSIHGDEITGYVLMLRYIDYLLTNYGTNPKITSILDNSEIYICPLANPDGTFAGGDNTVAGATRSNKNGIDMNRNYPDPQDGLHPDGEVYQQETQMFMTFAKNHDFVMAVTFHGGAETVNYPWDTWTHVSPDVNWWTYISKMYADTAHLNSPSGYLTNPNASGITNGYAWYEVNGGRQDYMNVWQHCREVTIELSDDKTPAASKLPNLWNYNYKSFLNLLRQSLCGIKGLVTDSCTGKPIRAKLTINNHDKDSTEVYSSLPIGNYHRPIYNGTYSLTFSAPGYNSKTINNVTATNGNIVIRDVKLICKNVEIAELGNNYYISLYPNPSNGTFNVDIEASGNINNVSHNKCQLEIIDLLGNILITKNVSLNKNDNPVTFNLSNYSSGLYLAKIMFDDKTYLKKIVIQ